METGNEDGAWLRKKNGHNHINVAELDAVLKGVDLGLKWSLRNIKVRTDSDTVVVGWRSTDERNHRDDRETPLVEPERVDYGVQYGVMSVFCSVWEEHNRCVDEIEGLGKCPGRGRKGEKPSAAQWGRPSQNVPHGS